MQSPSPALAHFFEAFERSSDSGDVPAIIPQFADTFMAAGPQGALCVRAADFAVALPRRKQFFDSLGCQSTTLVSLEENRLNDRYTMAKTQWRMSFAQNGVFKEALASSIFILEASGEDFKIVFYLANQDHMSMLRAHGILPD
jgi:hypothetical protein